ncbi:sigma-54-dependent transcriptional regulator [Flavihumibacter stibioxidans]|uniref:Sigma-54-dependent Fis family transcriptional regulator n=1 Tax=Flavihumibacter stibioxidans TaxID=1834163 RepID=A0ABR7MC97_9BACT|nr:sigma-54 dependent transcriptional regulator [Flavihumibacter stibioxidans]MBC6492663.1 sigma-54-dependent Fis family transcriptional regulator [Flavihumibacter stibioxidans]
MKGKVLIIDDEEKLRSLLGRLLKLEGYIITETGNLKAARIALSNDEPDVILCDVKLPDGNGVDFVSEIKQNHSFAEIILLTAYGNIPDGIQAMKNGAFDYITKGDDNNKLIPLLANAMEKVALQKRVQQLESLVGKKYSFDSILGQSKPIQAAIALARKVAATDTTVLLLGETGTGKEVFAQSIHNAGARCRKSFIALNCSTFTKNLLESELFGHKAGAFTGAIKDKKGLMEEANGGTLFLDEIGEMPLDLQSKLLRVLENGEFIKVGDTKSTKVNVRIIAATNRNLQEQVSKAEFREDLFYRLNVFTIELPPLRERKEDITLLADYYVRLFSAKTNKKIKSISKDAIKLLEAHTWKGNIRELRNVIERAVILENTEQLSTNALPYDIQHHILASENAFDLSLVEKKHIQSVLNYTKGNKTETARLLNIGLTTLYRKMEEYGISK